MLIPLLHLSFADDGALVSVLGRHRPCRPTSYSHFLEIAEGVEAGENSRTLEGRSRPTRPGLPVGPTDIGPGAPGPHRSAFSSCAFSRIRWRPYQVQCEAPIHLLAPL